MKRRNYEVALDAFGQAQREFEKSLGASHSFTLQAIAHRAYCYGEMGELDKAARLYERVLHFDHASPRQNRLWTEDINRRLKWLKQQQSSEGKQP